MATYKKMLQFKTELLLNYVKNIKNTCQIFLSFKIKFSIISLQYLVII